MAAVAGFLNVALNTISNVLSVSQIGLEIWLFSGGWMYALRKIEFFIDCKIVNFISYAYNYFNMILNGTMFNEEVTEAILGNIYIFIGVIVFFRLMMLVIKYLINPDLVADAKIGVNALIQRVIIGSCGILFIPTIFDIALDLQAAILNDQIVQRLIIPSDIIETVGNKIQYGGKYIGTYVLSGFVSPSSSASSKTTNEYDVALAKGDLSSISINRGGWMADEDTYEYEYFILLSTFVLFYVFYQLLKYAIDVAVRAFKMLLYQILAPVAMVEYMINGSDDGVFKNWRSAVLSTYCMIFVRVMAIWFVVFVTLIMSGDLPGYADGSLLATDDYLLRAIIIIALLGFMMDLPKIIGQIFGLDLEQESSATGMLKQVGGLLKSVATAGLSMGGAAVGSMANSAVGMAKLGSTMHKNKKEADANANPLSFSDNLKNSVKESGLEKRLSEGNAASRKAIFGAIPFVSNAYNGASGVVNAGKQGAESGENKYKSDKEKEEAQKRQQWEDQNEFARKASIVAGRVADSNTYEDSDAGKARFRQDVQMQMYGDLSAMISNVVADLGSLQARNGGGAISGDDIVETVSRRYEEQTGSPAPSDIKQTVLQEVQTAVRNGADFSDLTDVSAVVTASVNAVQTQQAPEIEQVVNQVWGTKVNNESLTTTQTVNQKLGEIATNTADTASSVTRQVSIQEDIKTNTERTATTLDEVKVNTEKTADSLDDIKRDTHNIDSKIS